MRCLNVEDDPMEGFRDRAQQKTVPLKLRTFIISMLFTFLPGELILNLFCQTKNKVLYKKKKNFRIELNYL